MFLLIFRITKILFSYTSLSLLLTLIFEGIDNPNQFHCRSNNDGDSSADEKEIARTTMTVEHEISRIESTSKNVETSTFQRSSKEIPKLKPQSSKPGKLQQKSIVI